MSVKPNQPTEHNLVTLAITKDLPMLLVEYDPKAEFPYRVMVDVNYQNEIKIASANVKSEQK